MILITPKSNLKFQMLSCVTRVMKFLSIIGKRKNSDINIIPEEEING